MREPETIPTAESFLPMAEVARRLGYSRSDCVDRFVARCPEFPAFRVIPGRGRGLLESELTAWLRSLPEAEETETTRKAREAA